MRLDNVSIVKFVSFRLKELQFFSYRVHVPLFLVSTEKFFPQKMRVCQRQYYLLSKLTKFQMRKCMKEQRKIAGKIRLNVKDLDGFRHVRVIYKGCLFNFANFKPPFPCLRLSTFP